MGYASSVSHFIFYFILFLKRTFQTHVVRLAVEAGTWATLYRMMYPGGTTGTSPRKADVDEYAATLERTERKHVHITKIVFMGLPSSKRKALMEQCDVAFPTRKVTPLDS